MDDDKTNANFDMHSALLLEDFVKKGAHNKAECISSRWCTGHSPVLKSSKPEEQTDLKQQGIAGVSQAIWGLKSLSKAQVP